MYGKTRLQSAFVCLKLVNFFLTNWQLFFFGGPTNLTCLCTFLGPDGSAKLEFEMPPKEIMSKLLDNIEAQLPREDHVKYDSRAKKLDWEKIRVDGYNPDQCKKLWYYIQDRIRRFRIMAELIPDARTWISQPWTNFYKSKDHNRHPDMPKKPLSMYMLFYSEKREEILRTNNSLSMPEVAKICSEQYQKLSDKKKAKYKQRCDDMRRQYEEKLASFYANYPELKPVKGKKHALKIYDQFALNTS